MLVGLHLDGCAVHTRVDPRPVSECIHCDFGIGSKHWTHDTWNMYPIIKIKYSQSFVMCRCCIGETFTLQLASEGIGYLRPGLRSVRGHHLKSVIFLRDPDHNSPPGGRRDDLTRYGIYEQASSLHSTSLCSPQASLFKRDTPALGR
jgi:hypothetical protein